MSTSPAPESIALFFKNGNSDKELTELILRLTPTLYACFLG